LRGRWSSFLAAYEAIYRMISQLKLRQRAKPGGHVREYYIAAEEVEWDYAPSGLELMHGDDIPFPWGLYRRWKKTRYVEYTDASFSQRKPQPEWLGRDAHHRRIEVQGHHMIAFQPRLKVHVAAGRRRPPQPAQMPLTLPGPESSHRTAALERHRPRRGQWQSALGTALGHIDDLEIVNRGLISRSVLER